VICGFGRTGEMWGSTTYGLQPDMISSAKALSASYQPISALMISQPVHEALLEGSRRFGSFGHGFTYGGHPVACAVALEVLKIYAETHLVDHVKAVSPAFLSALERVRDHPLVGDVRGIGLIAGVELMKDKGSKTPFDPVERVGAKVEAACLEQGLIVRAIGDRIAFCPPLIMEAPALAEIGRRFEVALLNVSATLEPAGA
jgi:4-aminobutyrate--pyruvate transaminase